MKDFEKTARELIRDYGFDHAFLEGAIRAALLQVHRNALEQAAGVAEGNSPGFDHQLALSECRDYEAGFHSGRGRAAAAIRALHTRTGGETQEESAAKEPAGK